MILNIQSLRVFCFIGVLSVLGSCKDSNDHQERDTNQDHLVVPIDLKWSERMALSEIYRFPDPTLLDFRDKPGWSYTNGLVLQAISQVYDQTKDKKLYEYIYEYADRMIDSVGNIETYSIDKYNLDMIKSGDPIFYLYDKTNEPRFKMAMDTLHQQLEDQPTTTKGGYWHKKRYPNQMWLDGVYMAEPFHAKYAMKFFTGDTLSKTLDKIVTQFDLIESHNRSVETGLYYHGWDESKEQKWANDSTGLSENFWSRGMGWYGMALVDVLDYIPIDHPGRERIINYLNHYAESIVKYQDDTGTWYQVLDQGNREANYLEATGTSMFTYTLAKAVNKGYIPETFMVNAKKAYEGILKEFITVEENGIVNLNKCCGVAGLGGDPYRDGTYDYYVNEIIRSNDPKGTGPFILASLQLDR